MHACIKTSIVLPLVVLLGACSSGPSERLATLRAGDVIYPLDAAGLIERLRAGNIDQPGSKAFNRWGGGYLPGLAASDRKFHAPVARE